MSLQTHPGQGKFLSLSTIHLTKEAGDALTLLASGRHTSEYVFPLEMGYLVRLSSYLMTLGLEGVDESLKTLFKTISEAGFKMVMFDVDAVESDYLPRGDGEPLDPEDYAKNGTICPVCRSSELEGKGVNIDGKNATQEVKCSACSAVWFDHYTLTSYSDLVVPDKAEVQS